MPCPTGFLEKFRELQAFRLHTGNINAYSELKLKRFSSSADELSECLKIQMSSTPLATDFRNNGTLLLCDNAHIDKYDRDDLKITMKLFVSSWSSEDILSAVGALKEQLGTHSVELLILAFPELEITPESEDEEQERQLWIQQTMPLWRTLEELVKSGDVVSLGVADLALPLLSALCDEVPPELQSFAKDNDIQLLTHNDPLPFPTREVFRTFCTLREESPLCCDLFQPTWIVRYTVWVRRRSVMASKGYIVQFVATPQHKHDPQST